MSYSISLNLNKRKALVVGAGPVAFRKINSLKEAGAQVTVVALEISTHVKKISDIICIVKEYEHSDIEGAFVVIAATSVKEVNQNIIRDCRKKNILCSCVDKKIPADFHMAACLNRGDLTVAIHTTAKVPGVSRSLKKRLNKIISTEWGAFINYLGEKRTLIQQLPPSEKRESLLRSFTEEEVIEILENEGLTQAQKHVEKMLEDYV